VSYIEDLMYSKVGLNNAEKICVYCYLEVLRKTSEISTYKLAVGGLLKEQLLFFFLYSRTLKAWYLK